ncbi:hypothetical protein ACFYMW_03330 [Streptomyces sp. NPDC006692]|uniref:hypothetical protein n=1 Tax=unclassified Streptomyces TaxID=2593676 RepID=UPI0036A4C2CF
MTTVDHLPVTRDIRHSVPDWQPRIVIGPAVLDIIGLENPRRSRRPDPVGTRAVNGDGER